MDSSCDGLNITQMPVEIKNMFGIKSPDICKDLGDCMTVEHVFTNPLVLFDILTTGPKGEKCYSKLARFYAGYYGDINNDDRALVKGFIDKMQLYVPHHVKRDFAILKSLHRLPSSAQATSDHMIMEDQLRLLLGHLFGTGTFAFRSYDKALYDAVLKCFFQVEFRAYRRLSKRFRKDYLTFAELFNHKGIPVGSAGMFRKWCLEYLGNLNLNFQDKLSIAHLLVDKQSLRNLTCTRGAEAAIANLVMAYFGVESDCENDPEDVVLGEVCFGVDTLIESLGLTRDALIDVLQDNKMDLQFFPSGNIFLFVEDPDMIQTHYQRIPQCVYDTLTFESKVDFMIKTRRFDVEGNVRTKGKMLLEILRMIVDGDCELEDVNGFKDLLHPVIAAPLCDLVEDMPSEHFDLVKGLFSGLDACKLFADFDFSMYNGRLPRLSLYLLRNNNRQATVPTIVAQFVVGRPNLKAAYERFAADLGIRNFMKFMARFKKHLGWVFAQIYHVADRHIQMQNTDDKTMINVSIDGFSFKVPRGAKIVSLYGFLKAISRIETDKCLTAIVDPGNSVLALEDVLHEDEMHLQTRPLRDAHELARLARNIDKMIAASIDEI